MTFDCADPEAVAGFWAATPGYETMALGAVDVAISLTDRRGPQMVRRRPQARAVKNRFHLDLKSGDRDTEVALLVRLDETVLWVYDGIRENWTTMAYAEGSEFCVGCGPLATTGKLPARSDYRGSHPRAKLLLDTAWESVRPLGFTRANMQEVQPMPEEINNDVVRRSVEEVWNGRHLGAIGELLSQTTPRIGR